MGQKSCKAYLCAMEGPFIVLHLLLMLLATVYIAFACSCYKRTFESYLCDSESTVIRARVISAKMVDRDGNPLTDEEKNDTIFMDYEVSTKYLMQLQKTFKMGSNQISTFHSLFKMIAIRADSLCGFVLDTNTDYLLVGNTDLNGEFSTNMCNVIIPWDEVSESKLDFLEGRRAPNCETVSGYSFNI
ncbi:hypothetical protein CHS0354_002121 [Potamilus streckersoni]|uniref:NTR domain-containing protein n=1 Tax=Potamilus streckersoni TaxID=2493646 RepID=A0AAE0TIX0_9BIVA|nr:hypothetical protein CHS0354_002121 [Potamilus streckersoni]